MTLAAPSFDAAPEVVPPAHVAVDALALRRALHAARCGMLRRNPPGRPLDPRDAKAVHDLEAVWCELPEDAQDHASDAFDQEHRCRGLAICPMGAR